MDERDVVPRREAVVGLSLLGLFSLTLTGTLAYRIVYPTKHVSPKVVVINDWKSQGPLPDNPSELFAPATDAPQIANGEFPTVDPIPTIADDSLSIPASANNEAPPQIEAAGPNEPEQPTVAPTAAPTFVSPSYR